MGKSLLTCKSRNDSKTVVLLKLTQTLVMAHKSWDGGTHCKQLNRLESIISNLFSLSKPLPCNSAGIPRLKVFFAA